MKVVAAASADNLEHRPSPYTAVAAAVAGHILVAAVVGKTAARQTTTVVEIGEAAAVVVEESEVVAERHTQLSLLCSSEEVQAIQAALSDPRSALLARDCGRRRRMNGDTLIQLPLAGMTRR